MLNFSLLQSWLNSLTLRNKVIFVVLINIVIFVFWYSVLFSALSIQVSQAKLNIQTKTDLVNGLETRVNKIKALTSETGLAPEELRLKQLQTEKINLEDKFKAYSAYVVTHNQLPEIMQKLMNVQGVANVVINRLEVAHPVPSQFAKVENEVPLLFDNAMTLHFQANFFDSLRYLDYIEKMPWRFQVNDVRYDVETYPRATVSLNLQIYSIDEEKPHE